MGSRDRKPNIYLYLTGDEKAKLMALLFEADNLKEEYLEGLEKIKNYLEGLKKKYETLRDKKEEYQEAYNVISKILEGFDDMVYSIPSPYDIVSSLNRKGD
jgi:cytochrome c peroxidase